MRQCQKRETKSGGLRTFMPVQPAAYLLSVPLSAAFVILFMRRTPKEDMG